MSVLTRTLTGRRTAWVVVVLSLLLGGIVLGFGGSASSAPDAASSLPRGAQSTTVAELQAELPQRDGSVAAVLFTADSGTLDAAQRAAIDDRASALGAIGGTPTPGVPSADGTAVLVSVPIASSADVNEAVAEVRAVARVGLPTGVSAQATGPAAITADLNGVFDGADLRLLLATVLVVAVLLVVTYRSPFLWVIPLVVVGVADRVAVVAATSALDAVGLPFDQATAGILSVLVFGAGTDYALLLISRYRDELRREPDRRLAMARALPRTAEAVLSSSLTVVLGVLTLLLSLVPSTRALGLACAVGIVVAAFGALVVLPATLVLFGRWVFWPVVPRVGDLGATERPGFWHTIGDRVARRPRTFVAATVVLLAVLASGVSGITVGLSSSQQFTAKPEAIVAGERLAESFPAGAADPTVVVTTPAAVGEVERLVTGTGGVAAVSAGPATADLATLDVVLTAEPGSDAARSTITDLRAALADVPSTYVGGTEASALDARDAATRDLRVIVPLVLLLVLIVLVVLLRSVVAPVILVATVVATYAASLGLSWWLFTGVLGFEALDLGVPLLSFLFLVALGVDYNIFLVTRAREEAAEHGSRAGMLRALTATGGVITSAGILLAAVFAVLGVLPLVALAQLGTVIFVGVLLDTLVVRTVLVPAIAIWLGDRFWWPARPASAMAAGESSDPAEPAEPGEQRLTAVD